MQKLDPRVKGNTLQMANLGAQATALDREADATDAESLRTRQRQAALWDEVPEFKAKSARLTAEVEAQEKLIAELLREEMELGEKIADLSGEVRLVVYRRLPQLLHPLPITPARTEWYVS